MLLTRYSHTGHISEELLVEMNSILDTVIITIIDYCLSIPLGHFLFTFSSSFIFAISHFRHVFFRHWWYITLYFLRFLHYAFIIFFFVISPFLLFFFFFLLSPFFIFIITAISFISNIDTLRLLPTLLLRHR